MADNQVTARARLESGDMDMDDGDAVLPNAAGELLDLLEEDRDDASSCEMDEGKEKPPSAGEAEALAVLREYHFLACLQS